MGELAALTLAGWEGYPLLHPPRDPPPHTFKLLPMQLYRHTCTHSQTQIDTNTHIDTQTDKHTHMTNTNTHTHAHTHT